MTRIKLQIPERFSFSTTLTVRITDLNYGGHLGNDAVLSLLHEARMQFLQSLGYTEMNLAGCGLIMADAAIEFKSEAFYGDVLTAEVTVAAISRVGFEMYYRLSKNTAPNTVVVIAKTAMVCFDYAAKKITAVPPDFIKKVQN